MTTHRAPTRPLAWLMAGVFGLAVLGGAGAAVSALYARAAVEEAVPERAPLAVETGRIALQAEHTVRESFAGRVEPQRTTEAAFERAGLVVVVLADEGDIVAEGAVLARLDAEPLEIEQRRLTAEREALEAEIALAEATTGRARRLIGEGWASGQALDDARFSRAALVARREGVEASLARVALDLAKSEITAPFAGRIVERQVDEGAVVSAGRPLLTLQETARPQARIGLPPERAAGLSPGDPVTVRHAGRALDGAVAATIPDLDPATRTVSVLVDLPPEAAIAMGEIVRLELTRSVGGGTPGAWVPLAALSEAERGLWSLLTVVPGEHGPVIARETVEIVHVEGARAFVRGTLRDGAEIVLDGAHRLSAGQRVAPRRHPGLEG